jgi:hypothetical protein
MSSLMNLDLRVKAFFPENEKDDFFSVFQVKTADLNKNLII